MFKRFKLVSVARDQNINIKLALDHCQTVCISPWDYLVSVTETNSELSNAHHLLLRIT